MTKARFTISALVLFATLLFGVSGCNARLVLFPTPVVTPSPTRTVKAPTATSGTRPATTSTPRVTSMTPTAAAPNTTPMPVATVTPAPTLVPTAMPTRTPTPPSPTPAFTATPTKPAAGKGTVSVTTVTLAAYPWDRFLQDAVDSASGVTYKKLDWGAYQASGPRPSPRDFRAIVMENEALQLTILPDLGGRLYRAVHKATGRDLFYRNPVLKPTKWGPTQQGWWLGAGGLEWCLPVDEHGLEWAQPWEYSTARTDSASTITLWDTRASDRLRARVTITLVDGATSFSLSPRLENPTATEKRYQFWVNAMVSGADGRVPPNLVFLFPTDKAIVHSTDDTSLPAARGAFYWPLVSGRDLTHYADWRGWLGIFAATPGGRMGIYDPVSHFGVIRTYLADVARGAKLFAGKGLDPGLWTDDGSTYVELWGGANRTFFSEDDRTLAPGAAVEWTESWSVTTTGF